MRYKKVIKDNLNYLKPIYLQRYNIDLNDFLKRLNAASLFETDINWKVCKENNFEEYHKNYSTATHLSKIRIPLFIYFCEDDPIISTTCIDYEEALKNDKVMICSNKYGGHLCSYEHFFMIDQFLPKPAFEFLDYFRRNNLMG
jgi:predicted alpha/beta-fold hydrolase